MPKTIMTRDLVQLNDSPQLVTRRQFVASTVGAFVASAMVGQDASAQVTSITTFDYYISPNGNDANPGTLASPFAITSLQFGNKNNALLAAKRVGLLPGTYDISRLASGRSSTDYTSPVLSIPSGKSGTPTYLASCNTSGNYSPRTATISNVGGQTTNAPIGQESTQSGNFTIDGIVLNITGQSASGIYCNYGGNVYVGPGTVTGIVIQNCEIYGLNGVTIGNNYALIALQNAYGAVIRNNKLHDYAGWDTAHINGYLEYCCTNSIITQNTFYNGPGGTHMKAGCAGQEISYNYFYNLSSCAVRGLDGAQGNPNTPSNGYSVHHNVFDTCASVGVTDINSTRYQSLSFYNNTTFSAAAGVAGGLNLPMSGGATCAFYNNICYAPNATSGWGSGGAWGTSPGTFTSWDYNCYFATAYTTFWGFYYSTVYSSLASWQAAPGSPDAHSLLANPGFVSVPKSGGGAAQFKLSGSSPCLAAGQGGSAMGAWDGKATQIGCDFTGGIAPAAPTSLQIA